MGFVQADPIRAPARAQDLVLRHRVKKYLAGDLERRFATLDIEEDFFVLYGFVTSSLQALMHPRADSRAPTDEDGRTWPNAQRKRAKLLLEFVRQRGTVHPREVDEYFAHGKVKNYWGGSSNATTHLLDAMHYRGMLRVVRRQKGIRIYTTHEHETGPNNAAERQARIISWWMWSFVSMRRCRVRVSGSMCDACATQCPSGAKSWRALWNGRSSGFRMHASPALNGTGPARRT